MTTNITHGYQGNNSKLVSFYKLWAPLYDVSVKLDPAYHKNLKKMITSTVSKGDYTLDIGCGSGLGILYAATISKKIIGIDSSAEMLNKLQNKISKRKLDNISYKKGFFPECLCFDQNYGSIITSFMLVHLEKNQRTHAIQTIYNLLKPGGRVGMFSAQGEAAPAFEKRNEIITNLSNAGFDNILIEDVDDIYRIATAKK